MHFKPNTCFGFKRPSLQARGDRSLTFAARIQAISRGNSNPAVGDGARNFNEAKKSEPRTKRAVSIALATAPRFVRIPRANIAGRSEAVAMCLALGCGR